MAYALLCAGMLLQAVTAGCEYSRREQYRPYFDAVAQRKAAGDGLFELSHPLISDINGAYSIDSVTLVRRAALDGAGMVADGDDSVLRIEMTDIGATLTALDDKRLSLRLEIGRDGTVSRGLFGSERGAIDAGIARYDNDRFVSGRVYLMYADENVAMGQLQVRFEGHGIDGSFRALVTQR